MNLTERKIRHELPEDVDFQSSKNQVRELQEHIGWRDVTRFLDDHILWAYNKLEDTETTDQMKFYQGQIKMAKTILGLPDHIIEQIQIEEDAREQS